MKKLISLLLFLALTLTGTAMAEKSVIGLQKDLIILYTSDVHCSVDDGWGYAGLAAVKEKLSKDHHVLLVDNGDSFQGTPLGTITSGEDILEIMNTVGYDATVPGNHDFDYGVDRFLELAEKARFPYICCNFTKNNEPVLPPSLIKEVDGVKIGFIGICTPATLFISTPTFFMNNQREFIYDFMQDKSGQKLYSAVQKAIDDVRAEGADYVIAIAHLGNGEASKPWRYNDVIANTSGIDAILDGHSHDTEQVIMQDKDGKKVIRSACGAKMANIGALTIAKDGNISSELYSWNSEKATSWLLDLDNPTGKMVTVKKSTLDNNLQIVVAKSTVNLYVYDPTAMISDSQPVRIIRNMETNLGDLCADAYLDQSGEADIALVNSGGIRENLEAGDVTYNDILNVQPFGNNLSIIEVTGQQVLDALEWSVHLLPGEFSGFSQVAGLTFEVVSTIPSPCVMDGNQFFDHVDESMERRVRNVKVSDEPLNPDKSYKVTGVDYQMLKEGDGYTMFQGARVIQESIKLDNQVLIDYISKTMNGIVGTEYTNPYGQGRILFR